jgi:hypothetical protein
VTGKRTKKIELVGCGSCKRLLKLADYYGDPREETEPQRIHKVAYPALDGVSVFCTCGHYTLFFNPANKEVPE